MKILEKLTQIIRKLVGFAIVFEDTTRRGALPEEASIHTIEIIAIKIALIEIQKRWVIYTDSQSSIQSIKYKKQIIWF